MSLVVLVAAMAVAAAQVSDDTPDKDPTDFEEAMKTIDLLRQERVLLLRNLASANNRVATLSEAKEQQKRLQALHDDVTAEQVSVLEPRALRLLAEELEAAMRVDDLLRDGRRRNRSSGFDLLWSVLVARNSSSFVQTRVQTHSEVHIDASIAAASSAVWLQDQAIATAASAVLPDQFDVKAQAIVRVLEAVEVAPEWSYEAWLFNPWERRYEQAARRTELWQSPLLSRSADEYYSTVTILGSDIPVRGYVVEAPLSPAILRWDDTVTKALVPTLERKDGLVGLDQLVVVGCVTLSHEIEYLPVVGVIVSVDEDVFGVALRWPLGKECMGSGVYNLRGVLLGVVTRVIAANDIEAFLLPLGS